jgi:hypothetical protein
VAFALNSSNPAMCCSRGHSCQFYTEHFWQCMPDSMQDSNKPVGTWDDQCGGDKVGFNEWMEPGGCKQSTCNLQRVSLSRGAAAGGHSVNA